jgi:hypothetical protein
MDGDDLSGGLWFGVRLCTPVSPASSDGFSELYNVAALRWREAANCSG